MTTSNIEKIKQKIISKNKLHTTFNKIKNKESVITTPVGSNINVKPDTLPTVDFAFRNTLFRDIPDYDILEVAKEMKKHTGRDLKVLAEYSRIANVWFNEVPGYVIDLMYTQKNKFDKDEDMFLLPIGKLRNYFNTRYTPIGASSTKKKYWFYWFHERYPLWSEQRKGHIKSTSTHIIPAMRYCLQKYANRSYEQIRQCDDRSIQDHEHYDDLVTIPCPIDTASLGNYIHDCKSKLAVVVLDPDKDFTKQERAFHSKIFKNWMAAVKLNSLAMTSPQVYDNKLCGYTHNIDLKYSQPIKHGRRYPVGTGLGLAPRLVRHAALGNSWEVDLDSGVFSYMRLLAHQFNKAGGDISCIIIDKLLDNKDAFREKIAIDCMKGLMHKDGELYTLEKKIKLVKQAVTSLSFGGQARQNGFSAVGKVVYWSKEHQKLLVNHPYIKGIVEFRDEIATALELFTNNHPDILEQFLDDNGNYDAFKHLSEQYYVYERECMDEIAKYLNDNDKYGVLLYVHDAVYCRYRPPIDVINDIIQKKNFWQRVSSQQFFKFKGYNKKESDMQSIIDKEEMEHKSRMITEQLKAAAFYNNDTSSIKNLQFNLTETDVQEEYIKGHYGSNTQQQMYKISKPNTEHNSGNPCITAEYLEEFYSEDS